ncbi:MAG: hypothetical protein A2W91_19995 [Bacteroidetes bacterium GWF2_38_335]|nr:MAG: hypothetical protein A2W91_19995 [Bacteroidetes bacterium GWF2_38_335]OFY81998.1 MAG: hypothetical protein A2281_09925 [Bacteroidetes bacterium RIFOXYA12_FULL_38_20]HBS86502.1 hypothetical protein [Bacteroidales bacterium]
MTQTKKNPVNRKYIFALLMVVVSILIFSLDTYARAGGGGGDSGGGGDAGALFEILFYIFWLIPSPYNFVVAAVVIFVFYFYGKKWKQSAKAKSILNTLPTGEGVKNVPGFASFQLNNPEFNENDFKNKVKIAFTDIQNAWASKDMTKVRKYISDGMYQRLNTQFKMMDLLEQTNKLEKIHIKNVYIDKIDTDGSFDVIHCAVHATINDKFVSEKYSNLNSGGSEEFVEYWSFIKKRGAAEKDMYSTDNCPNCGAQIKNSGEMCKCEYCGAMTNSGEYDWVLAEITQADDYITTNPKVFKSANLEDKVYELFAGVDDFSIQGIEDKVSNGYLQIQTALVYKDPKIMRRFVSDSLFEKVSKQIETEQKYVYNRIYLNDVTLIGASKSNNKHVLTVAVKSSYQRVSIDGNKATKIDAAVNSGTEIVFVSRDINAGTNKGSIYSHSCPSCGGPIGDTIELKCQYCGADVNSTANEWIITDIMNPGAYMNYYSAHAVEFIAQVDPSKMDSMYKVRDYAFNNLLIMIAADGVFDSEEQKYAEKMAKKWGYNVSKLEPMFKMAQGGSLTLRMPDDPKDREKIYKMMEKAANADGSIGKEEQELLDYMKNTYGIAG